MPRVMVRSAVRLLRHLLCSVCLRWQGYLFTTAVLCSETLRSSTSACDELVHRSQSSAGRRFLQHRCTFAAPTLPEVGVSMVQLLSLRCRKAIVLACDLESYTRFCARTAPASPCPDADLRTLWAAVCSAAPAGGR